MCSKIKKYVRIIFQTKVFFMSDIDSKINNTEEQAATKNVRLKYQKNIDKNHLLQSLESGYN